MMAASNSQNRKMFWRIMRRMFDGHPGRLFVVLLALGAGAAVTAALVNLQIDAKRRLTTEFRAFGANVIIRGKDDSGSPNSPSTPRLDDKMPLSTDGSEVTPAALLYLLVEANPYKQVSPSREAVPVILVGLDGQDVQRVLPSRIVEFSEQPPSPSLDQLSGPDSTGAGQQHGCRVGQKAAAALHIHSGERIQLSNRTNRALCFVSTVEEFGGPEDNQVFTDLFTVQKLTWVYGEPTTNNVSVILLNVPGTPAQVASYIATLEKQFPDLEIRPIRQITEGEAKIYGRISGLLTATVLVVLVLTSLCVMAAMTNVAMERRNDVGLMKAIGGATRRVVRLFLAEAALLGLVGGILGAAAGILLSMRLGKQIFGVAAQPRLIVYPVTVALTMIVSILSAFPLRRLASVRPASVFRGEA